ncbi:cytochrome c oxidase subunit NDUFA4-like [Glossophaga mutica]
MLLQILCQGKNHLSLIPLFGADVCWDKKNNSELWNKLDPSDQYKFYSVNVNYRKLKKEGLDF